MRRRSFGLAFALLVWMDWAAAGVSSEVGPDLTEHVQDGTELAYFPTDVVNGELWPPLEGHNPRREVDGTAYYLPMEYEPVSQRREGGIPSDPLGPSCWFTYGEGQPFAPSRTFAAEALYRRIKLAYDRGASNVLLSTAPDHTGRMRPADVQELVKLGELLAKPTQAALYSPDLIDAAMRDALQALICRSAR